MNAPARIAVAAPAAALFSLLRRTMELPAPWAALVTVAGGVRRFVAPGGVVDGTGAVELTLVDTAPQVVELMYDGIATRDGYLGRARVALKVAAVAEAAELEAFARRVIGSAGSVDASALGRYFEAELGRATRTCAAGHDAVALSEDVHSGEMMRSVANAAESLCFSGGMRLLEPPRVRFESEAFRRVRWAQQDALRRRREHEAAMQLQEAVDAARRGHLDRLTELLERLRTLTQDSPEVDLPGLIRTFAEHERGHLYEALFAAPAGGAATRAVVVATAGQLLFFDPAQLGEPVRRVAVEGDAGPVRSVRWIGGRTTEGDASAGEDGGDGGDGGLAGKLLVGAATGVYIVDAEGAAPQRTYRVENPPVVRGGFNAVARHGGNLYASHSELGVVRWDADGAARGPSGETGQAGTAGRAVLASVTRGAAAVRGLQCHDHVMYCGVDDRVVAWPADEVRDVPQRILTASSVGGATVTALCADESGVYAGDAEGKVMRWSGDDARPEVLHAGSGRAVESLHVRCAGGVRRLVFTDTGLSIHVRVLGDTFTCRYEASGQTLRRVEVGPDLITATNDLRDRLLHWKPAQAERPFAVAEIGRLTGHSIQDVCLIIDKV